MASSNPRPSSGNQASANDSKAGKPASTTDGNAAASGKNQGRRRKNRPRGKNGVVQHGSMSAATDQPDQLNDGAANNQVDSNTALSTKSGLSGKESNTTKSRGKNRRGGRGRGKGESGNVQVKDTTNLKSDKESNESEVHKEENSSLDQEDNREQPFLERRREKKRRQRRRKRALGATNATNSSSEDEKSPSSKAEGDKTAGNVEGRTMNDGCDPRGEDPSKRMPIRSGSAPNRGRNTESFDPTSTLVRPTLRVHVASPSTERYLKPLKHDDAVLIPEMFGPQDDWGTYFKLIEEISKLQQDEVEGSEWTPWHEGTHLIVKNPKGSKTFQEIVDKVCHYFDIDKDTIFTRLNWYKDSTDWKPFHHDSAAFNKERAKRQNISVGVSFGASRELAFLRARGNAQQSNANASEDPTLLYFPQHNNGCVTFCRDVNINFKHGINALSEDEQDGKGRISIIIWGLARNVVEEEGSPLMFGAGGKATTSTQKRNTKVERNRRRNLRRKQKRLAERLLHQQQQILATGENRDDADADSIAGESFDESEEDEKPSEVLDEAISVSIEIEEERSVVDLEEDEVQNEVVEPSVEIEEEGSLADEEKIQNEPRNVSIEIEEEGAGLKVEEEKNIMYC